MTELPIEALADDAAERLMRYARIDTQSDKHSTSFPSTEKQWDLLRLLRDELVAPGPVDVDLDEHGYLFATVPATVSHDVPAIGFLAHVDTTPDVSGTNVKPQRIRYEGGEIVLPGDERQVITVENSPELADHERLHDAARRRRQGWCRRDHDGGRPPARASRAATRAAADRVQPRRGAR